MKYDYVKPAATNTTHNPKVLMVAIDHQIDRASWRVSRFVRKSLIRKCSLAMPWLNEITGRTGTSAAPISVALIEPGVAVAVE